MSNRITSSLFVSALLRSTQLAGGFATVLHKGSQEAGAITIALFEPAASRYQLYEPAVDFDGARDERRFRQRENPLSPDELTAMIEREKRFDPDFWLIEIEGCSIEALEIVQLSR